MCPKCNKKLTGRLKYCGFCRSYFKQNFIGQSQWTDS